MAVIIDEKLVDSIIKPRGREGHKGLFGHTGIFAGSLTYVGAPYFAAEAAVRSGSGLVTLFVYEEILEIMKGKLNEEIVRVNPFMKNIFPGSYQEFGEKNSIENKAGVASEKSKLGNKILKRSDENEFMKKLTAIVFGSGMGDSERTVFTFMKLKDLDTPLVIDADGLNILRKLRIGNEVQDSIENIEVHEKKEKAISYQVRLKERSRGLDFLKTRKAYTVLTPHMGEFARLSGKTVDEILKDRESIAMEFAKSYRVVLVLKDSQTIITDGEKIYLNDTGNSSMSNGGMGDVLAGMIGSLISQGYTPIEAGILGTYILGKSGEELSKDRFIVNPRDIIEEIPLTMKKIALRK